MASQTNCYCHSIRWYFWWHAVYYRPSILFVEDWCMDVPAMFPVPIIDKTFDEKGNAIDKEATDKRAAIFNTELIWFIEARAKMEVYYY